MSGKHFFDSNILVYSVGLKDAKKADIAYGVIRSAAVAQNGVVSYQILQEFMNVGFKKFVPRLTPDGASLYLAGWLADFQVVSWTPALMEDAFHIKGRYGFQWYDCLMMAAALSAGCDTLYSEDLQHEQVIRGLTIINPFI